MDGLQIVWICFHSLVLICFMIQRACHLSILSVCSLPPILLRIPFKTGITLQFLISFGPCLLLDLTPREGVPRWTSEDQKGRDFLALSSCVVFVWWCALIDFNLSLDPIEPFVLSDSFIWLNRKKEDQDAYCNLYPHALLFARLKKSLICWWFKGILWNCYN